MMWGNLEAPWQIESGSDNYWESKMNIHNRYHFHYAVWSRSFLTHCLKYVLFVKKYLYQEETEYYIMCWKCLHPSNFYSCLMQTGEDFPKFCFKCTTQCYVSVFRMRCGFLTPRERPGTHCTGGWVGLRACLDRCGKSRPHRNSIPRPSSP